MSFLAPIFFWTFLSLIPLTAIYFLKVRPRRKDTTAFFLWEKVFTEKRSSSLFNRLRDIWSLLLMLLVFSAVAFALTRPERTDDTRKDLLILVDQSASMSAGDGRTRLNRALNQARDIIRALNGSQRAAVASVASEVTFHSHLTDNPRELLEALDRIEETDLPLEPRALGSLYAGDEKEWNEQHRVLFLTDGAFPVESVPEEIELLKIGEKLENVGIVAADLQLLPGGGGGDPLSLSLYFQLASSYTAPVECDLVLRRQDTDALSKLIPVTVEPGMNAPEIYNLEVEDIGDGRWVAELELKDAAAKDNVAYLTAQKPRPIRITVDTADRYFFENSVNAFSGASGLLVLTTTDPQVTIAKGQLPEGPPFGLVFQPNGDSPWWENAGAMIEESIVSRVLLKDHPALRHLDAGSISFVGAREIDAPPGALILVASDKDVPLIYQLKRDGRSVVVVNMDPMAAEFYFSAWFPVLVHSVATYLAGREEGLMATYQVGSTVPVPGVQADDASSATNPAGTKEDILGKSYGPLQTLGFYFLENGAGQWPVASSLLTPTESLLDNSDVKDTSQPLSKGYPLAYLLTLLAIIVLVAESFLYHRRKVG